MQLVQTKISREMSTRTLCSANMKKKNSDHRTGLISELQDEGATGPAKIRYIVPIALLIRVKCLFLEG